MTAVFGMAVNYAMLFAARVGTAIGEAGGSPPSHSLISDYFSKSRRGTAFSIFALGVPIGTSLGAALGGWGNQTIGWRMTFVLAGVPGIVIALIPVADGEGAAARTVRRRLARRRRAGARAGHVRRAAHALAAARRFAT